MTHLIASSRALHLLDGALALWVAAWIGLGVAIGVNVRDLTHLSRTVVVDGQAVETVGRSLHSLGAIPFVGGQLSRESNAVIRAGASAVSGGQSSGSSIRALSVLLAIAVALLPSVPVLGFYLPARLEHGRESRALREALRIHAGDPAFQAFLGQRALATLSYHRLRRVAPLPWAQAAEGQYEDLAAAELRRLGVDPALLRGAAPSTRGEESRR